MFNFRLLANLLKRRYGSVYIKIERGLVGYGCTIILHFLFSMDRVYAQQSAVDRGVPDLQSSVATEQLTSADIGHLVISSPQSGWALCLLLEGPRLIYTAQIFGVQSRYGSLSAEWRNHRPKGFPTDDEVGLITEAELTETMRTLQKNLSQSTLQSSWDLTPPPCDVGMVEQRPLASSTDGQELSAEIWISAERAKHQTGIVHRGWAHWRIKNPHLMSSHVLDVLDTIRALIYRGASPRADVDRLMHPSEQAKLQLKVEREAKIWIDGVYMGIWPSTQLIPLTSGHYTIKAVSLAQPEVSVVYEEVEVLAGRLTRFEIRLETL